MNSYDGTIEHGAHLLFTNIKDINERIFWLDYHFHIQLAESGFPEKIDARKTFSFLDKKIKVSKPWEFGCSRRKTYYSCIYKIRNKLNQEFYIGSCFDFYDRKASHLSDLRRKKHHSYKLQIAYDKYGEENFEFSAIRRFYYENNSPDIRDMEWLYIKMLKPQYNILLDPSQTPISAKKNKEQKTIDYEIFHPNGKITITKNLSEFCNNHNLEYGNLTRVLSGKCSQHKGYKCRKLGDEFSYIPRKGKNRNFKYKRYVVQLPNKQEIVVENLTEFAKQNDLSYKCLIECLRGKSFAHKGFRIRSYESDYIFNSKELTGKRSKKWKIKCPDNSIVETKGLEEFCRKRGINCNSFRSRFKNNKSYLGYEKL